jgi:DNA-binding NtrC family response regulator
MDRARIAQSAVLIIEGDPHSAGRCEALVESLGATPILAATFAEARKLLNIVIPDVVVASQEVTDASGVDMIHDLRQRPQHRRTPAILLSEEISTNELERAVMAGIYATLRKPFEAPEFIQLVCSAIEGNGRHTGKRELDETRRL